MIATTPWKANVLSLFPEMFPGSLGLSLSGKALSRGVWALDVINIRDHALNRHRTVDDTPFGGGAGMIMRSDVLEQAISAIDQPGRKICLSPRGRVLDQNLVRELAAEPAITLLCGRYEGIDQRFLDSQEMEDISIGDYVLSGGEPAALVLIDAVVRLLPGVMGNDKTAGDESFETGLLEYPQYTRPSVWTDAAGVERHVPEILLSGHHANIAAWRCDQAEGLTRERRPDLWACHAQASRTKKS